MLWSSSDGRCNLQRNITLAAILLGFTALSSQVVFIREFIAVFFGNELSLAFILGSWLIGGAVGSGIFGKFSDRMVRKDICLVFSFIFIAAAILFIHVS